MLNPGSSIYSFISNLVSTNKKGSGETVRLRRIARAFAGRVFFFLFQRFFKRAKRDYPSDFRPNLDQRKTPCLSDSGINHR